MDADGAYMEINTSTARCAGNKQQQYVNVGPFSKQAGNSKGVYANT